MLGVQHGLQAGLCRTNPVAAGRTHPAHGNGGARGQLPLGPGNYTTCVALLLSNCAVRSSHVNILSV